MKKISQLLLCTAMLFGFLTGYGQFIERQLISSLGELSDSPSFKVSATGGELMINTIKSENLNLTIGFQQPNPEDFTGLDKLEFNEFKIEIYPNPLFHQLSVSFHTEGNFIGYYLIHDRLGKMVGPVSRIKFNSNTSITIDCHQWDAGDYYLSVFDDSQKLLKTLKIIKL